MNNPTPEQIRQILAALQNERRLYRTHGAKVRDALLHVHQSKEKPGW